MTTRCTTEPAVLVSRTNPGRDKDFRAIGQTGEIDVFRSFRESAWDEKYTQFRKYR